jgi:hypothetical protein
MRHIKTLFSVTAIAAFAFTAVPLATAAAAEETKILPEPTEAAPLQATLTQSTEGHTLMVGGFELGKCRGASGSETWTSANSGTWRVILPECKWVKGTTCTSAGAPEGSIEVKGKVHFWLALLMTGTKEHETSELVGALVFLYESVTIACGVFYKFEIPPGCVAAQVLPKSLNSLIAEAHQEFSEWSSGEQRILYVLPQESKKELECLLRASFDGGPEELTALDALLVTDQFKKSGSAITIELMNP